MFSLTSSCSSRLIHTSGAALVAAAICTTASADVADFRVIAVTGDNAPGVNGSTYTGFGFPFMNATGKVTFMGWTSSPIVPTGMWGTETNNPQSIAIIAGENFLVPGMPETVRFGQFDNSFFHPLVNDNGNVGFCARLVGSEIGDKGLFREIDGVLEAVALPGGDVPGLQDVTYTTFGNLVHFNNYDALAFEAQFAGNGINGSNDAGVFSHWFGGVQMYMRKGWSAPGLQNMTIEDFSFVGPQLNDDGQMAFVARLDNNDRVAFSGWPGLVDPIIVEGDVSPLGETYTGFGSGFWGLFQTGTGTVVPMTTNGGLGFYHATANETTLVVRENTAGPLGVFDDLNNHDGSANAHGDVLFSAVLAGNGVVEDNDTAIFVKRFGQPIQVVVREDDPAYGFGANVVIDDVAHWSYYSKALDDDGLIFYQANVRGPGITNDDNTALWAIDQLGNTHLMIKEGQFIEVKPNDWRQVDHFTFREETGTESGRRPAISDDGAMALHITFADDTQAIVAAELPQFCAADLNGDGWVNTQDLLILLGTYGETGPIGTGGDVDHDGDTDITDLLELLSAWGACVPV